MEQDVTRLRPNLQSANISYSMQKRRLLFKIGYVCKIPLGGGGQGMTIWPTVYSRFVKFEISMILANLTWLFFQIIEYVSPKMISVFILNQVLQTDLNCGMPSRISQNQSHNEAKQF